MRGDHGGKINNEILVVAVFETWRPRLQILVVAVVAVVTGVLVAVVLVVAVVEGRGVIIGAGAIAGAGAAIIAVDFCLQLRTLPPPPRPAPTFLPARYIHMAVCQP